MSTPRLFQPATEQARPYTLPLTLREAWLLLDALDTHLEYVGDGPASSPVLDLRARVMNLEIGERP